MPDPTPDSAAGTGPAPGTGAAPGAGLVSRSLARLPRHYLHRPGLQRRLAEGSPLTVLQGPPGSGKTTLAVSWVERCTDATVVWVDAEPDLDDPERFWQHVLASVAPAAPSPPRPALRALRGVLRDWTGCRIVLVVDRFDRIRDRRVAVDLVELVARQRNLQVCLCVRGRHPVDTLGPGYVETTTIGPTDLLLSVPEVAALAEVLGKPVDPVAAARVQDTTGGWVAAARRILESSPPGELDLSLAQDYLREAVLPQLGDGAAIRGLMRLCLVRRPPRGLLDDLYPADEAGAVLDTLALLGLPGDRDGMLTLPAMVRAALRDKFTRREPGAAAEFHRRAGEWFARHAREPGNGAAHADAAEALRHLVAGQAWPEVAALWSRFGTDLLTRFPDEVRDALAAVPDEMLRAQPGMLIAREVVGALAGPGNDAAAAALRAFLDVGEQLGASTHLDTLPLPSLLSAGTCYLASLCARDRCGVAEAFATDVERRLTARAPWDELNPGDVAWFQVQRGLNLTMRGEDRAAIRCYRQAWEHGSSVDGHAAAAYAAANLAMIHAVHGRRRDALCWLTRLGRVDTSTQWVHDLVHSGAGIARGVLALDAMDPAGAARELARLTEGSWGETADVLWPFAAHLDARYGLHDGNPAGALVNLAQVTRAHGDADREPDAEPGVAATLLARDRADLLMACGEGNRARQEIAGLDPRTAAVPQARLYLLCGDHEAAASVAAGTLWHPECSERDHLELLLVRAVCALYLDQAATAAALFTQAVQCGRAGRMLRAFATIGADDLATLVALVPGTLAATEPAALATVRPVFTAPLILVHLTRQEQRVLAELGRSASNKDIAEALFVSVSTVKTQLQAIYRKLGTTNRQETILRASELTLLPEHPGRPSAARDPGCPRRARSSSPTRPGSTT
jgi:ATP/maltotriose-dependent transcriptional regulator MalT